MMKKLAWVAAMLAVMAIGGYASMTLWDMWVRSVVRDVIEEERPRCAATSRSQE